MKSKAPYAIPQVVRLIESHIGRMPLELQERLRVLYAEFLAKLPQDQEAASRDFLRQLDGLDFEFLRPVIEETKGVPDPSGLPQAPPMPLPELPLRLEERPLELANGPRAEPPSKEPLVRYPGMEYPNVALVNASITLTLALRRDPPEGGGVGVSFDDPDEPVKVVVRATDCLFPEGDSRLLALKPDQDSLETLQLIPLKVGSVSVMAEFWYKKRPVATVKGLINVVPNPVASVSVRTTDTAEFDDPDGPEPDLILRVRIHPTQPKVLEFELESYKESLSHLTGPRGRVTLRQAPEQKMAKVYERLSKMAREAKDRQHEALEHLGNELWDLLIPPELQAAYWDFHNQVQSLLVRSSEPHIPWEIVKPYRRVDGVPQQEPFWCERFGMARWLDTGGPSTNLGVRKLVAVAPDPQKVTPPLPYLEDEEEYLYQTLPTLRDGLQPLPPCRTSEQVLTAFEQLDFTLMHVAAHGIFDAKDANDSAIVLEDGRLQPSEIKVEFGHKRPRPLVFINACEGARLGQTLTGLGGWAEQLVRSARVAAFVGAAWEVRDDLALSFARAFYEGLLKDNEPVAESFRKARLKVRDAQPQNRDNSTWLAYVLYAYPGAVVR